MPDQVNINAGGAPDALTLAMTAHSLALTTATQMQAHIDQCRVRDERYEKIFDKTQASIQDVDDKLDAQTITLSDKIDSKHNELVDDQKSSNRLLYMIVGGITLASALLSKLPFTFHF